MTVGWLSPAIHWVNHESSSCDFDQQQQPTMNIQFDGHSGATCLLHFSATEHSRGFHFSLFGVVYFIVLIWFYIFFLMWVFLMLSQSTELISSRFWIIKQLHSAYLQRNWELLWKEWNEKWPLSRNCCRNEVAVIRVQFCDLARQTVTARKSEQTKKKTMRTHPRFPHAFPSQGIALGESVSDAKYCCCFCFLIRIYACVKCEPVYNTQTARW